MTNSEAHVPKSFGISCKEYRNDFLYYCVSLLTSIAFMNLDYEISRWIGIVVFFVSILWFLVQTVRRVHAMSDWKWSIIWIPVIFALPPLSFFALIYLMKKERI